MKPMFFEDSAALRAWLDAHHASEDVLWVGFWKKSTGRPGIAWQELVDELLCFGWIDGLRKSIDEERWMIRTTPRRARSSWSDVNQKRFAELSGQGRVMPAGQEAYRRWESSAAAASRSEAAEFGPDFEHRFRARPAAWEFFESQPAGYRRTAMRFVMSAKREEARLRRLERLIEDSAAGLRIKELRRPGK